MSLISSMQPWQEEVSAITERKIFSYFDSFENINLLDFGAGYGRYLNMFSKKINKKNLVGAEIDPNSYLKLLELGYECYQPDFHKPVIPYPDEHFNYIFSSNVLEHIPNEYYLKYLKEFFRILKPEGKFIFGAPNYPIKRIYDILKAFRTRKFKYYLFDDPTHINKLSIIEYENDFRNIFNEVELEPSRILFENRLNFISNNRTRFRIFGDKIIGYCKK